MQIIFMGSPEFALPSLNALRREYDLCAVVTQPDRPSGRGRALQESAVKREASAYKIPVIQPENLRETKVYSHLASLRPGLIVVAAYGQILPRKILELPVHGSINVHASLLPRWRGAAPVQAAILAGDAQTGVTIMKMDAGLDTGPILKQTATPIRPDETGGELESRLARMGGELLVESIPGYLSGDITPTPQEDAQSTYAPMLKKRDGEIDPELDAERLARQVRAFEPWPSSFFYWSDLRIVVRAARATLIQGTKIGEIILVEGLPAISTASGALVLERVQPAGKREMNAGDFLNGAPDLIGAQLTRS
ncbi:MAG: methionyl-tRNA formyltransferase [Anaerolineales bacterium]|nr:methionyl-tRNA formyltransferase [Anaerolineales bacterium]